jgi:hypothetical protein
MIKSDGTVMMTHIKEVDPVTPDLILHARARAPPRILFELLTY